MSFSADLKRYKNLSQKMLTAVVRESVEEMAVEASKPVARGGKMPVITGFLRGSVVLDHGRTPPPNRVLRNKPRGVVSVPFSGDLSAAGMKMGDFAAIQWTARYAVHVEYGAGGRAARLFATSASKKWPAIVAKNAKEAERLMRG